MYAIRGCPYQCTFCANPVWCHKSNPLPVQEVIKYLELLSKKGIKNVFFFDDTLNLNGNWFSELCTGIIKAGLNNRMIFQGGFRGDLTTRNHLELARKAGFWIIFFGAESGSQKILDYYRKGETTEDIANAIEMTHSAGLRSIASFIVGSPIDTWETILETANFIRGVSPTYIYILLLMPIMGTKVAEDVIAKGLLSSEEVRNYNLCPTIRTETLSTEELIESRKFIWEDFLRYKKSDVHHIRRQREFLSEKINDSLPLDKFIRHEIQAAETLSVSDIPDNLVYYDHSSSDLEWMTDEITLFTRDIRLRHGEWHLSERNLRWSYPVFELPFFLEKPKDCLEIHWASMRPDTKIRLSFVNSDKTFSLSVSITNCDWHINTIRLGRAIQGPVWVKFEISEPFFAPNDPRELGMAFRTIRFVSASDEGAN
jgi:hypothetical protein